VAIKQQVLDIIFIVGDAHMRAVRLFDDRVISLL